MFLTFLNKQIQPLTYRRDGEKESFKMNTEKKFQEIVLANIQPSLMNPRKTFAGRKFDELVASVRKVGVIEPILVRPIEKGKYEIVAGERRFRASSLIASENGGPKKHSIPAMVQEMTDDEAFDLMTIENLQREDLTELEEAQGFKVYLDKKGAESLPELAERTGINPHYISRRILVLTLPPKVLKAWEKGQIKYGHCEQLCRIKDKKLIAEYLEELLNEHHPMTVRGLKQHIDEHAVPLKSAKFNREEAGCAACQANSEVQAALFDESCEEAYCTNSACFKKKQGDWLTENWKKYGKSIGTNSFRFATDLKWNEHHDFDTWVGKPTEKCKECLHFVSILNIDGKFQDKHSCVGDESCFNAVTRASKSAEKKTTDKGKGKEDPDAPRVSWHGEYFREEFYKTRLPEVMSVLPIDDLRVLQLSLMALINSNSAAAEICANQWANEALTKKNYYETVDRNKLWEKITAMTREEILRAHRDLASPIVMQKNTFIAEQRHTIAGFVEIDLSKEWRFTEEYLAKKTAKEILNMIAKLGIDQDVKAQAYLYETLGKKRGRFDTCKKGELVDIILKSGMDLAGKVPDEILKTEKPSSARNC